MIAWDREWSRERLWDCLGGRGPSARADGEFYCATKVGKNRKQVVKMHNNIILQLFIKKGNTIFRALCSLAFRIRFFPSRIAKNVIVDFREKHGNQLKQ